jgi:nucleotide-binding universal stress UspA family protein
VLQLVSATPPTGGQARAFAEETVDSIIKDMAEAAEIESVHAGRTAPPVDITTLLRREPTEEAIADEAKKGYDMLLVGVEPAVAVQGEIDEKVARVSQAFEGPLAIAVARGSHREEPAAATHLNILVPVTGTEYSRRGAEVALALARASLGSVTVLYVARRGRSARRHGMILASALIGEASVATKKRSCARPSNLATDSACRCEPPSACTPTRRRPSSSS